MELATIWLYGLLALVGLFFQLLLHGGLRMIIYPLSLVLGAVAGYASPFRYHAISFNLGMIITAAIGGYWRCVIVESACLIAGFLVGIYLF